MSEREREMIGRTMFTEANNTKMRKKEQRIVDTKIINIFV